MVRTIAIFAALAALLAPAGPLTAQAENIEAAPDAHDRAFAADFEAFLAESMARFPGMPALSVAVVRTDGPLIVTALGEADIETGIAAAPDTRFYIASSTKSFVGTAMALLDARGEIDLDWTLAGLAPDVEFTPEIHADEVTLRHMLSHSHGLLGDPIEFRLAYSGEHDPETLWGLLPGLQPNDDAPLGSFDYSNFGYNLATMLVERRLGRRWQEIVRTEILDPLDLNETSVDGLIEARAAHSFALPYLGMPEGPERLYLVKTDRTMQSAGGLYASANDMASWLGFELAAARGRATGPLAEAAAAAQAPAVSLDASFGRFMRAHYGLGWYSGPYRGETLYHAFGSFVGARAHGSFLPDRDLGVAILTNDAGAGFFFADIAAAYAYDWFIEGPEAAAAQSEQAMAALAEPMEGRLASLAAARTEAARRQFQLSLAPEAYAGQYCNARYGTITVLENAGALSVEMGALHASAAAGEAPESLRAELIPPGGTGLTFDVDRGRAEAVHAFGALFGRCGTAR